MTMKRATLALTLLLLALAYATLSATAETPTPYPTPPVACCELPYLPPSSGQSSRVWMAGVFGNYQQPQLTEGTRMIKHWSLFKVAYSDTKLSISGYHITVVHSMTMAAVDTNHVNMLWDTWVAEYGEPDTSYNLIHVELMPGTVYVLPAVWAQP